MAFVQTALTKITRSGGVIVETGTWLANAGTAAGTLTRNAVDFGRAGDVQINDIESFTIGNDNDNATSKNLASSVTVGLTFTADDNGTYTLIGKGV